MYQSPMMANSQPAAGVGTQSNQARVIERTSKYGYLVLKNKRVLLNSSKPSDRFQLSSTTGTQVFQSAVHVEDEYTKLGALVLTNLTMWSSIETL
jgi:hypothetical protein